MFRFYVGRDNVQNWQHRNSPPGRLPRCEMISFLGNKPGGLHLFYSVLQCLIVRRKCYDALSQSASSLLPIKEESHITTILADESICRRINRLIRPSEWPLLFWTIDSNMGVHIPFLKILASAAQAFFVFDHISTSLYIFINRLPGLLVLPSFGIHIPFLAKDVFMMEVFHDVQIQRLKHPASYIE